MAEDTKLKKVDKILKRLQYASRAVADWNKVADEDIDFALGKQWTEEQIQTLEAQGRPALTFNKIGVQINVVEGHQRLNAPRIKVSPEGGEDQYFSEANDKGLDHISKVAHLDQKLNAMFRAGIIPGKSWIEMSIDYDRDPLRGELKFGLPGIKSVVVDPDSVEYDLSDAEYLYKLTRYNKERLKSLFPKKKGVIDAFSSTNEPFDDAGFALEGDKDNYEQRPPNVESTAPTDPNSETEIDEDKKFTLVEYYYKKYITKFFLYDYENKSMEAFETEEEAKAEKDKREKAAQEKQQQVAALGLAEGQVEGEIAPVPEKYTVLERSIPEMWLCQLCNRQILNEDKSPMEPHYSGFPLFRFCSEFNYFTDDSVLKIKGLSRPLKDSQRECNKSRSQFLHILNTSANSGWIGDDDALGVEAKKDLENMGSKAGVIIWKKKGSELKRIEPVAPSMAQMVRDKAATENFKEITGINPDLLSLEDKTTSGRALNIRVKQGLTILAATFSNFKHTKEQIGRAILSMMPSLFDGKKWAKIMGEKWMQSSGVDEGIFNAYLAMIKDNKYNISIDDSTIKTETFEQLMELVEKGAPIPIDLLLEYSDIPNSADVIARVKQAQQAQQAQAPAAPGSK